MKGFYALILAVAAASASGQSLRAAPVQVQPTAQEMKDLEGAIGTVTAQVPIATLPPMEKPPMEKQKQWPKWQLSDEELARMFAPQLRFDQKAKTFPQSPEWFWNNSHTDEATGNRVRNQPQTRSWKFDPSKMATLYDVTTCENGQVLIEYWWFYSFQNPCMILPMYPTKDQLDLHLHPGTHNGDWERIVVALNEERTLPIRVTWHQHRGHYTRHSFERAVWDDPAHPDFKRPVVYVGKNSHGSYHDDGGSGGCLYFEDFRNQGNRKLRYDANRQGTLLPVRGNKEWQNFRGRWGANVNVNYHGIHQTTTTGKYGPITQDPVCRRKRCSWDGCNKNMGFNWAQLDRPYGPDGR